MFRKNGLPILPLILLAGCAQQADSRGVPWWGWLILIVLIVVVLWLIFRPHTSAAVEEEVSTRLDQVAEPVPQTPVSTGPAVVTRPETPPPSPHVLETHEPLQSEDLTLIEGIGPKINSVLHAAGILTFAQLAAMEPERVKAILVDHGIQLADTTTWPEQAHLAAEGEMEKLKKYQDELKGGRVV